MVERNRRLSSSKARSGGMAGRGAGDGKSRWSRKIETVGHARARPTLDHIIVALKETQLFLAPWAIQFSTTAISAAGSGSLPCGMRMEASTSPATRR